MFILLLLLIAYIIGSFPTGYLLARIRGIADIRQHGSGTIGATNVARHLGLPYFFFVLLCDAGKAYIFLLCAARVCTSYELYFLSLALLCGNAYSIFLQGTSGKGVATMCGIIAALQPYAVIPLFCVWIISLLLTHTVGISSVIAAAFMPVYAYSCVSEFSFFIWSIGSFIWILVLHRKNMRAYF